MSTSIRDRQKDIGILRALGASHWDVAKIFLWEGGLLAGVAGSVTIGLLLILSNWLNRSLIANMMVRLTPFMVTFRQVFLIYLVVLGVTLFASLLPLRRITKKKPIDAIVNRT